MPKQIRHIGRFDGGMNTDYAPEDIAENQLIEAVGISVSKLGRIQTHGDIKASSGIAAKEALDLAGYGLFTFDSDYNQSGAQTATKYLTKGDGSTVFIYDGSSWVSSFDLGENKNTDASSTVATQLSFYAPNGDLRVADGIFNNSNNNANNPTWYGYIPPKTYGPASSDADASVGGIWRDYLASVEGGYPRDANGIATNAFMANNDKSATTDLGSLNDGTVEWGARLTYAESSTAGTWQPSTDVDYKFYASYVYDNGQEGHPTPFKMYPTLRDYTDGADAVVSSDTLKFVDTSSDANYNYCTVSRSGTTVTVNTFDNAARDSAETHNIEVGDTIIIEGSDSLRGIFTVTVDNDADTFTYEHGTSGTVSAENAYYSKVGTNLSLFFNPATKVNIDTSTAFCFGGQLIGYTQTTDLDVSSDVATVNTTSAHGLETGDYVFVNCTTGGADAYDLLTTPVKITKTDADTFTYTYPSSVSDTTNKAATIWSAGNERIVGTRYYYSSSDEGHGNLWILFDCDFEKGVKAYGLGKSEPTVSDYIPWVEILAEDAMYTGWTSATTDDNLFLYPPKYETYESLNGYRHDSKIQAKWKTAVIANGRAYIANIQRNQVATFNAVSRTNGAQEYSSTTTNDPIFGDRIIKSPVGKYDVFPEENALELLGSDDGDEIVKLEAFADRLLVFKKNTLHILNISRDVEVLESSHKGLGLDNGKPHQSCLTSSGVAWINSKGAYHYNGQLIESLTDGKIEALWKGQPKSIGNGSDETAFWLSDANDHPTIGYDESSNKILCSKTAHSGGSDTEDILIYDMNLKAWTKMSNAMNNDVVKSNFGNYNGMFIYHEDLASGSNDVTLKYSDTPSAVSTLSFYTKPYHFGAPLQRKKIYKVYITYRCGDGSGADPSNVHVKYYVNGNTSALYDFTTNSSNPFMDNDDSINLVSSVAELDDTDGNWETASLVPATSSEANNIKSFGLKFFNESGENVDADFEINDISIVHRIKSAK